MGRSKELRTGKLQPKVLETYETGRMGRLFKTLRATQNDIVSQKPKSTTVSTPERIDEKSSHSSRLPSFSPEEADIRSKPEQPEPEQPEPEQQELPLPKGWYQVPLDEGEPSLFCHKNSATVTFLWDRKEDLRYAALVPVSESEG